VDITDARAVASLAERLAAADVSVDVLVNNAALDAPVSASGLAGPARFETFTVERWQDEVSVGLTGTFLCCQAFGRTMTEAGAGRIVNVASVAGLRPSPLMGAYNISKAGLVHMTRQLALELAPDIRVNAVAPAVVKTRLAGLLLENEEATAAMHPMHRVGNPEDVARMIVFLASDASSWMTGTVVPVDGGVTGAGSSGIS
jgi:3-oxoacyl-[acyl-carrier protein] reductase